VAIASAFGRPQGDPRMPMRELGRILLLPPNWALAAGLLVNLSGLGDLPSGIERPMEILAGATLPLTMLYAGVMIDIRGLGGLWREVSYVTVVRLGLSAVIGAGLAVAVGLEGDVLHTVVIMAAMPTAMMSLVLGTRYGLRSDVLAGAVVVTTLLATVTLPAWRAVLL
jgi:predicted permease